jgi:nitrate reductase assembly molybdenum cofactor insertion protein NarJ
MLMYDMALRKSYNTKTVSVSFRKHLSIYLPLLLPFLLLISNESATNTKSKESHAEYRETKITHQHSLAFSSPCHSEVSDYLPDLHPNPHPSPCQGAY